MCWLCLKASVIGFDTLASIINCTPSVLVHAFNINYVVFGIHICNMLTILSKSASCLGYDIMWNELKILLPGLSWNWSCVVCWIFLWVLITIQVKYMFLELILFGDFVILCNFVCLWLLLLQYLEIVLPLDGTKDFGNRANRCSLICQVWSPNGSLQLQDNRIVCCSFVGILRWTNETSLAFFCHF